MRQVSEWYNRMIQNWQEALAQKTFRNYFAINFLGSFSLYFLVIQWVKMNSNSHGIVLDDPIYHMLAPRDFSPHIFFFTYSPVVLFLIYVAQYPLLLHRAFNSFVAVFIVRAICIQFIPLSPDAGIIVLNDPITNAVADESKVLNDLFFSGHIGDLASLFFLCRNRQLRAYLFVSMCVVGSLLVWQRVHYSIDVIAAPFFSYFCYWLLVERDIIWASYLKKPVFEHSRL